MIKIIPAPHRFEEEEGGVRPPPPMLGRGRSGLPHPRGWGRDPPPASKPKGFPFIHSLLAGQGRGQTIQLKKKSQFISILLFLVPPKTETSLA